MSTNKHVMRYELRGNGWVPTCLCGWRGKLIASGNWFDTRCPHEHEYENPKKRNIYITYEIGRLGTLYNVCAFSSLKECRKYQNKQNYKFKDIGRFVSRRTLILDEFVGS